MIKIRKSNERGHANHGWLDTYHTFSFADYYDPKFIHFRSLRVINEDKVAPGMGFAKHPHDNMEIITYVMKGQLQHNDSMGNGSIINANEFQIMSAGSGVYHSEFNASKTEEVHLYQIWIFTEEKDLPPTYAQKSKMDFKKDGNLTLIASRDERDNSLKIRQDASLYLANLNQGEVLNKEIEFGRSYWCQVTRGQIILGENELQAGDAFSLTDESILDFQSKVDDSEVLIFDLK